jgi:RNA polymerase sigma-70 factor (ECF subfamily)
MYKIIYNSSLDFLKHEKVREKHIEFIREAVPDAEATAFEKLDLKQLAASINEAVEGLPEQMRKILRTEPVRRIEVQGDRSTTKYFNKNS